MITQKPEEGKSGLARATFLVVQFSQGLQNRNFSNHPSTCLTATLQQDKEWHSGDGLNGYHFSSNDLYSTSIIILVSSMTRKLLTEQRGGVSPPFHCFLQ